MSLRDSVADIAARAFVVSKPIRAYPGSCHQACHDRALSVPRLVANAYLG
jgi:hypothetical protein